MRFITLVLVVTALAGCTHPGRRHPTADGSEGAAAKDRKAAPLPDGLVGDGEQHSYAEPPPRSS